ncbi:MAG: hypothetical protein Q8N47_21975 [Bryobacterales bacterium]|nr:hypothetical protein [Bryobacterales bacterium]
MAYADELLELAQHLANLDSTNPRQACLRRAVSTAYYALFHLLISEATLNWGRPELRSELGRLFEHGRMKNASVERRSALNAYFGKNPPSSQELVVSTHLRTVADRFIQAQQKRNDADYDTGKEWTQTDVLTQIAAVSAAFESWKAIRDEPAAQAYLVSLLSKRPRSE